MEGWPVLVILGFKERYVLLLSLDNYYVYDTKGVEICSLKKVVNNIRTISFIAHLNYIQIFKYIFVQKPDILILTCSGQPRLLDSIENVFTKVGNRRKRVYLFNNWPPKWPSINKLERSSNSLG